MYSEMWESKYLSWLERINEKQKISHRRNNSKIQLNNHGNGGKLDPHTTRINDQSLSSFVKGTSIKVSWLD